MSSWATGTSLTNEAPGSVRVFALFDHDDRHTGSPEQQSVMVNYRVDDLDAVVERLRERGAPTEGVVEEENGRFSWAVDPEGDRLELWEPTPDE